MDKPIENIKNILEYAVIQGGFRLIDETENSILIRDSKNDTDYRITINEEPV